MTEVEVSYPKVSIAVDIISCSSHITDQPGADVILINPELLKFV